MANIGDKYIIEISGVFKNEDQRFRKPLYKMTHFNSLVFDEEGISRLTPYEPNNDKEYQRGLNDAWEALRMMADKDMSCETLDRLFGEHMLAKIAREYTVTEVIDKLTDYEAEKKAEEETKVGDEVETDYTGNVIIAGKPKDGWYVTIAKNFARYSIHESHIIKKTGRHFPQVAELLDAMEEDGEI